MNKIQKFATMPEITSTYAGEAASGYIAAALLSANTLDKKLVTIMPNCIASQDDTNCCLHNCKLTWNSSGTNTLSVIDADAAAVKSQLASEIKLDKESF